MVLFAIALSSSIIISEGHSLNQIDASYALTSSAAAISREQAIIAAGQPSSMLNYTAAISGMHIAILNGTYVVEGDGGYLYAVT